MVCSIQKFGNTGTATLGGQDMSYADPTATVIPSFDAGLGMGAAPADQFGYGPSPAGGGQTLDFNNSMFPGAAGPAAAPAIDFSQPTGLGGDVSQAPQQLDFSQLPGMGGDASQAPQQLDLAALLGGAQGQNPFATQAPTA